MEGRVRNEVERVHFRIDDNFPIVDLDSCLSSSEGGHPAPPGLPGLQRDLRKNELLIFTENCLRHWGRNNFRDGPIREQRDKRPQSDQVISDGNYDRHELRERGHRKARRNYLAKERKTRRAPILISNEYEKESIETQDGITLPKRERRGELQYESLTSTRKRALKHKTALFCPREKDTVSSNTRLKQEQEIEHRDPGRHFHYNENNSRSDFNLTMRSPTLHDTLNVRASWTADKQTDGTSRCIHH
ncbi:hypothetical protein J6590_098461 [Homalodisca vitripennis]|nr:hypothetical protein J6590_098461 [Homalodisca vitripennis]